MLTSNPQSWKSQEMKCQIIQVDKKLEKGTIKTCLRKDPRSSKFPHEMECVCIHCYENNPADLAQLLLDSKARWTLHLYRPLYVERNKLCLTCKQFRRFVPIDTEVPSVEQIYLRNAAQIYLQFDDDSKGMLLDHLAPSNRRPRLAKGNSAHASTAQKSSDKAIYAALASTLKSPIAPEVANRNPSEIERGKRRKRKKSTPSVWSEQWPLRGAEQDHQDRLRRPQRDLSMVKVDDITTVVDMDSKTRKTRRRGLRRKMDRGEILSDFEQAQWQGLAPKR